jgi:hypothetical protein
MALRPCLGTPGHACGRLTTRPDSRCPACATAWHQARDARRGNRHQRGYGTDHDHRRDALIAKLRPGQPCDRCGQPMYASQALDAAHPHDRPLHTHPDAAADHLEHARCNRAAH